MAKTDSEKRLDALRKEIQSIEWDRQQGNFKKEKLLYYKELLQEFEKLREKIERD